MEPQAAPDLWTSWKEVTPTLLRKHIKCRALWAQCQQHVCTKNGSVDHVPAQPISTMLCIVCSVHTLTQFPEEKLGIVNHGVGEPKARHHAFMPVTRSWERTQ